MKWRERHTKDTAIQEKVIWDLMDIGWLEVIEMSCSTRKLAESEVSGN